MDMIRRRRLPVIRGDQGRLPWIHFDDAVSATVLALEGAPAGSIHDIVDDRAASFSEMVTSMAHGRRVSAPGAWASGKRDPFTPGDPRKARARL